MRLTAMCGRSATEPAFGRASAARRELLRDSRGEAQDVSLPIERIGHALANAWAQEPAGGRI